MRKALQAALLSGIVFPGFGQLWLKRYLPGAVLIVAVSASLGVVVMKAAHKALGILERMEAGGAVDMVAVADLATKASLTPDDFKTTAALVVLALSWLIGIADAYVAGRRLDQAGSPKRPPREKSTAQ